MGVISLDLKPFLSPVSPVGVDLRAAAMNMAQCFHRLPILDREYLIAELIPGSGRQAPNSDPEGHLRAFLALFIESGPVGQRPTPDQVLAGIEVYIRASLTERQLSTILSRMVTAMWIKGKATEAK